MKALNVLCVEDNPGDTGLLREMLKDTELEIQQVVCAETLGQARQKYIPKLFDVIFLDLSLPDVQGLETVKQMRVITSEVPIVVMTGLIDEAVGVQCIQTGAQDYLVKGRCDGALLKRVLRYVIERQRSEDLTRITGQLQAEVAEREKSEAALGLALEELKKSQANLMQAQKMESVGRLAGGVAHDFNNILTIVRGYLEMLLPQFPDDGRTRRDLLEIQLAAAQATSLTRQLLAFSRKQVLQPRVLQLNQLVTGIQQMLRRLMGEDIELVAKLDASLDNIKVDPGQIDQILMNLAANARDAMPQGGRLTIETARVEPEGNEKNARVMLCVGDSGCGMDEATQSHLFEPFYTTKEVGKGTGLGLATVYGIVQQSGGTIHVESALRKGTIFRIYFPAVSQRAASATIPSAAAPPVQGKGETILVVEDEPQIRALLLRGLAQRGYRVLEAGNGEEALSLCGPGKNDIDLVLTDMVMPRMGGGDFGKALQKVSPPPKILYMSGFSNHSAVEQELLGNEAAFIQKPFDLNDLAVKIRNLIDHLDQAA